MKKTSKDAGAAKKKIDYLEIVRNTPAHLRKRGTMEELRQRIEDARAEKLKRAS